MDYPLPWIRLCVIIKNLIVLPWFIFINQTYLCTLYMVEWCHPCPLCWVMNQAIMWGCHWWHLTKHNGQGWNNLNIIRSRERWQTQYWFWKSMFNKILVTVMNVWSSLKDHALERGQENNIIFHPGTLCKAWAYPNYCLKAS
jgi:hypothetical protein